MEQINYPHRINLNLSSGLDAYTEPATPELEKSISDEIARLDALLQPTQQEPMRLHKKSIAVLEEMSLEDRWQALIEWVHETYFIGKPYPFVYGQTPEKQAELLKQFIDTLPQPWYADYGWTSELKQQVEEWIVGRWEAIADTQFYGKAQTLKEILNAKQSDGRLGNDIEIGSARYELCKRFLKNPPPFLKDLPDILDKDLPQVVSIDHSLPAMVKQKQAILAQEPLMFTRNDDCPYELSTLRTMEQQERFLFVWENQPTLRQLRDKFGVNSNSWGDFKTKLNEKLPDCEIQCIEGQYKVISLNRT